MCAATTLCLTSLGYVDQAIEQYRFILTKNSKSLEGYYNLAIALQRRGSWDDAASSYRKVISMAPKNSLAYTGLGQCLLAKHEVQKTAVAAERKAIELYPNNY